MILLLLTTLVYFLMVFSLLVFAHELGHFLVAKWRGVRVEEFGFGYPPRLFTIMEIGGTKFTVNAIPFGGFVRFPGENDPTVPDGLASQGWRVRGGVFIAGAVMNMVLAALLFGATALIGEPVPITGVEITEVAFGSPAEVVGMKAEDLILELDGLAIADSEALQRYTYERVGQEVSLLLEREGERLQVTLTPRPQPPSGEGPMGIAMHTVIVGTELVRYEAWRAIPIGISRTFGAVRDIVIMVALSPLAIIVQDTVVLTPLLTSVHETFFAEVPAAGAVASASAQAALMGASFLSESAAFWSVYLGLISLLPFPGLDGGRLAFLLLEALRRARKIDPPSAMISAMGRYLSGVKMALTYPFQHRMWPITLFIGGALVWVAYSPVAIGHPVARMVPAALGGTYFEATLRNILRASKDPLPTWWDLLRNRRLVWDAFLDLVSDILGVVLLLVPLFAIFLAVRAVWGGVWWAVRGESVTALLDFLLPDYGSLPLIDYPFVLFLPFFLPALLVHSSTCAKFRSRFNHRAILILVMRNFRAYGMAWLQTLLLMIIVSSLLLLLPILVFVQTSNVPLAFEYKKMGERFLADWVTFYLGLGIIYLFGTALRPALGATVRRDEDT